MFAGGVSISRLQLLKLDTSLLLVSLSCSHLPKLGRRVYLNIKGELDLHKCNLIRRTLTMYQEYYHYKLAKS